MSGHLPGAESPWRVAGGAVDVTTLPTRSPRALEKHEARARLSEHVSAIGKLQRRLYAEDRQSMLLIFQALDAAGKDGTIRRLLTGVSPAGCQVTAFGRPSRTELDHDFLWRHVNALPERGRIGVHNRSWYEEVLAVRVHPEILAGQYLPERCRGPELWEGRLRSIRDLEAHLVRNGTVVLKFFLHVSRAEQARRLLARIDDPDRRWKFEPADLASRERWAAYMEAYSAAISGTNCPEAPWYAIPADHKWTARVAVADIVHRTLAGMQPRIPRPREIDWGKARERLQRTAGD